MTFLSLRLLELFFWARTLLKKLRQLNWKSKEFYLADFPFWPAAGRQQTSVFPPQMVFWSENHSLMLLSSKYLFEQWRMQQKSKLSASSSSGGASSSIPDVFCKGNAELCEKLDNLHETVLLMSYLEAHCSTLFNNGGVFEVLSHVYLPYTLTALWNMFDFSCSTRMRELAKTLIDSIVTQLLTCTTLSNGVCTLSASARAYTRTRLRVGNHNINGMMFLLLGVSPRGWEAVTECPTSIMDSLLTTKWRPSANVLSAVFVQRICNRPISPTTDTIRSKNMYPLVHESEVAPFHWSAGLVVHPDFVIGVCMWVGGVFSHLSHDDDVLPLVNY